VSRCAACEKRIMRKDREEYVVLRDSHGRAAQHFFHNRCAGAAAALVELYPNKWIMTVQNLEEGSELHEMMQRSGRPVRST
jgi:hypothetical protein